MKKHNKKGPSYLDVTEFILTGSFSPKFSPGIRPAEHEQPEVPLTFNNWTESKAVPLDAEQLCVHLAMKQHKPLFIELEKGQPSPYLKELLSKVGSEEIEFLDFTLEGHHHQADEEINEENWEQEEQNQEPPQMSVIAEEEESGQGNKSEEKHIFEPGYAAYPEEYVPNIHLLDMDPSLFSYHHFKKSLGTMAEHSEENKKEFIIQYLTDQDLETYKDASYDNLLEVVKFNLSSVGATTRLERKAKVLRYLQKKKRRIWRKKINYDCRKKVADNRLRVKGKFVTKSQACQLLGIEVETQQDIRNLLREQELKLSSDFLL